ncbi:NAD-dependent epimerase/dehydratase family protein [Nocardiopsis potens]|uniref:NAD-dependent epimerase/dehydratase family protein n=1 Tax=Nocardiopsis potens TaxID=1246458 RepID=UPI0003489E2F|nr:NmrA family NAD(P)-binding protein [Nocardiopsis potens]
MSILVTGGTGTTGSRIARRLADRGLPVRAASRSGAGGRARFDWYDAATHRAALAGATAVYLLAPVGDPDPEPVMRPFLELAARTGVRRAVLLGSSAIEPGAPGLGAVQTRLGELFGEWAVLRPSWFMENFTGDHPHARSARERGEIVTAAGRGRVAFVAADDIADVAAAALTDPEPHNTDHIITGPEALSHDEVAAILGAALGRPVRHRSVGAGELAAGLAEAGLPAEYAGLLAGLDTAIAAGAEDRTTTVVADLTGHAPRPFTEVVAAALAGRGRAGAP